jgi:hypothetical protein
MLGCTAAFPAPPMPHALHRVSFEQARAWVRPTIPATHEDLRFNWKFREPDQSLGGRGAAKIAPPDSLRVDFRGPLGAGAGAGVVIGDSAAWADPPDELDKLVPSYPLLWAMVGIARPPGPTWDVQGRADPGVVAWRYSRGADTVDWVRSRGGVDVLEVSFRQGGRVVGRVVTVFRPDGRPARSRLDVPSTPARLDITFDAGTRLAKFDQDMWNAPHDP